MKKSFKVAGLALALASSAAFTSIANAAENIAFIDSAFVFQNSSERAAAAKKLDDEFKAPAEALQKKEQAIVDKIQKLQKDAKNLKSAQIQKREEEINKLRVAYEKEAAELQQKYEARRMEEEGKIIAVMQNTLNEVAKAKNLTLVLDSRAVAYFSGEEKNITKDVLDRLNATPASTEKK